ncbi:NADH dehydrogenase [ubiquinone] 1 beta subcomplex subunit 11, mitochondrial [Parambassis ranga]|uniref:NADH dehydrogenase [ubiquinone] 1 beta subcomplex subunit 11, mitochondrial n=1 Tax=Parambassis ranga TaxID=210632 RepID=A0A6P7IMG5_9TELE|nr:NADH dehydrogenase [ubiquinone] 1 beta subcomplex subunit 11, mitochondrial [Parambassis ranga]
MLTRMLRFGPALPRLLSNQHARFVSQSKPSSATGSTAVTELHPSAEASGHAEVSPFVKNPDYHGFSSDPVEDEWNMKVGFFLGISVAVVIGGTFIHYLPDYGMRQWARREAERLIVERESEDLPLIGENYYDTNKIILPTAGEE